MRNSETKAFISKAKLKKINLGLIIFVVLGVFSPLVFLLKDKDVYTVTVPIVPTVEPKPILQEFGIDRQVVSMSIIKNYILDNNSDITDAKASKLAEVIVKESVDNNTSPYIQAALCKTESGFKDRPKHAIKTVYGISGVYGTVWEDFLKEKGIIRCERDLLNPYKNIASSSAILSYYMDKSKTPREAVARYKGLCSTGWARADQVMKDALKLKKQERELLEALA